MEHQRPSEHEVANKMNGDTRNTLSLPPPRDRWRRKHTSKTTIHFLSYSWARKSELSLCERAGLKDDDRRGKYKVLLNVDTTLFSNTSPFPTNFLGDWFPFRLEYEAADNEYTDELRSYKRPYIVVGIMNKKTGVPREILAHKIRKWRLFTEIRRAAQSLRPWWVRLFSLKAIWGFGIYECLPDHGYHIPLEMDHQTEAAIRELYRAYNNSRLVADRNDRWLNWVQEHFNAGDVILDPEEPDNINTKKPRLALELILTWSVLKIALYGLTPILLSLAIGFWFQYTQDGDRIAVVQTAWTISSYIIGASGVTLALLAVITQIGD
ncbi:hypothetical protein F5B21DRAFT_427493 [Xylaria acuta]|nr:hypothetical protein F5B21DRAFT_427493 [Xylaria acuta]